MFIFELTLKDDPSISTPFSALSRYACIRCSKNRCGSTHMEVKGHIYGDVHTQICVYNYIDIYTCLSLLYGITIRLRSTLLTAGKRKNTAFIVYTFEQHIIQT